MKDDERMMENTKTRKANGRVKSLHLLEEILEEEEGDGTKFLPNPCKEVEGEEEVIREDEGKEHKIIVRDRIFIHLR